MADDALLVRADLVKKLVVRDADGVPHLRLTDDHRCIALAGTLGRDVRCTTYAHRPTPCRQVQPGDALCRRYRHEHGMSIT